MAESEWNELVTSANRYESPGYNPGRPGNKEPYKITHIVIHITGSNKTDNDEDAFIAAKNEFLHNKKGIHYIIKIDGTITQFVKDSDRAWHAGISINGILITDQHHIPADGVKINESELYDRDTDEWKKWRLRWVPDYAYYYLEKPSSDNDWDIVHPGKDKPFNYTKRNCINVEGYDPKCDPNNYSIGIELVGWTFYITDDYYGERRRKQIDSLVKLLKNLTQKYGVPVDREHLVGHEDVNPIARFHWDPGPGFDWDDIIRRVKPQVAHPLQKDQETSTPYLWWYHGAEDSKKGGYYPVGANVCTHGGIHLFSNENKPVPVRAMAPGYIVAYRFLSPKIEKEMRDQQIAAFSSEIEGKRNTDFYDPSYSSLVLIRHDIKVNTTGHGEEDLCFYSLYMSLAPVRKERVSAVPWFENLIRLIKGAQVDTKNFGTFGNQKWLELTETKTPDRPGREDGHKVNALSIVTEDNFCLVRGNDKPDAVITFSEPLFRVEGGEIIGYIEKTNNPEDKNNFLHWEVFAPSGNDVFSKTAKAYKYDSLFKIINENDNYLTPDELGKVFSGETFFALGGITFGKIDVDWFKSLSSGAKAFFFPNEQNLNEYFFLDKVIFNKWLPIFFVKDNSYDVVFKITRPTNYKLNYTAITLKVYAFQTINANEIQLVGKKSGNRFEFIFTDDKKSGYTNEVTVGIDELMNGITLTLPTLATKLIIDDGDTTFASLTIKNDKENVLFNDESQDVLRNVVLRHKLLWTNESLMDLAKALEKNDVISTHDFKNENFNASAWLDPEKEKSIYGTVFGDSMLSPNGKYDNAHPVTASWLVALLLGEGAMRFDSNRLPAECETENTISQFAFCIPPTQFANTSADGSCTSLLGGKAKLVLIGKAIRPGKAPTGKIKMPSGEKFIEYDKSLSDLGIKTIEIPLNFWGIYDPALSGAECISSINKITVNKPVLTGVTYGNSDSVNLGESESPQLQFSLSSNEGDSRPIALIGVLCFSYVRKKKDKDPENEIEFKKGLIISAEREGGSKNLTASYRPTEIYKEIASSAGNIEEGETISLKAKFIAPNGGVSTLGTTIEKARKGNGMVEVKSEWKNSKESIACPSDFEYVPDILALPSLTYSKKHFLYPENKDNSYLVGCIASFVNEAWKWLAPNDFTIIAESENGETIPTSDVKYVRDDSGTVALSVCTRLPNDFFGEQGTSKAIITYSYRVDVTVDGNKSRKTIWEQRIEYDIPKPVINEASHTYDSTTGSLTLALKTSGFPHWAEFHVEITWKDEKARTWKNVMKPVKASKDDGALSFVIQNEFIAAGNISKISLFRKTIPDISFPAEISTETDFPIPEIRRSIDSGKLGKAYGYETTYVRSSPMYANEKKTNQVVLIPKQNNLRFLLTGEGKRQNETNSVDSKNKLDFYKIETVINNVTYQGWVLCGYVTHIQTPETDNGKDGTR